MAELKSATIAFTDLKDYTRLTAHLGSERLDELTGRIDAMAEAIVARHGGEVNRRDGDALMVLFGVPRVSAGFNDAVGAVRSMLELHRAVDELSRELNPALGHVLALHTGIESGHVVAKLSKDGKDGRWKIVGDQANLAKRLCDAASDGQIFLGRQTWNWVKGHFAFGAVKEITVKGVDRAVFVHEVLGERTQPGPIFGREKELRDFNRAAQACLDEGTGRLLIVHGHAGIGKSRLALEYAIRGSAHGYMCHSVAMPEFRQRRDVLRNLARTLLGIPLEAGEKLCREEIQRLVLDPDFHADLEIPLFDLLSVPIGPSQTALLAAMNPVTLGAAYDRTICALIEKACAQSPVLLEVEDVHWADKEHWILARLTSIAHLTSRLPLLVVMTVRRGDQDPTAGPWRAELLAPQMRSEDISLDRLSVEDAKLLATSVPCASRDMLDHCVHLANGSPLLLTQLLRAVDELDSQSLPTTIIALAQARVDQLNAREKWALQAASVLDRPFDLKTLRYVSDDRNFDCADLIQRQLIEAKDEGLILSHALIHEGVYSSLLTKSKQTLHVRAAEWFEPRNIAVAAWHFERAGDGRCVAAYLKASAASASQYQFTESLEHAEHAWQFAEAHSHERTERFESRLTMARLLIELGRASDAVKVCTHALQLCDGPAETARGLILQAAAMRLVDRIDDGFAALRVARPLARRAGLNAELAQLHHLRGNLRFPSGDSVRCVREHSLSLKYAKRASSLLDEAAALGGLGDAEYLRGRMVSAHEQFVRCVSLSVEHGFGRLEVANLPMVGWTLLYQNEMEQAVQVGRQAFNFAARVSQPRAKLLAWLLILWVDGLIRRSDDVEEGEFDRAVQLARSLGSNRFEVQLLAMWALFSLRNGNRVQADALVSQALSLCRPDAMKYIGPWVYGVQAMVKKDLVKRLSAIAAGERLLASGCVSHNHILFRELAIEAAVESGDCALVESTCDDLKRYTADQPLPFCEFLIERGVALCRWRQGHRSPSDRATLQRLRAAAITHQLASSITGLDAALAAVAPDGPRCR